jgi:hypothetical protein
MNLFSLAALAFVLLAGALLTAHAAAQASAPAHRCAASAQTQAKKLLRFHAEPGSGQPISVDKKITALAPLRNPADASQRFDVLEVTGYVYKAGYRMRFLFAQIDGPCVLIGQEILENTRL